jgi:hypothetical protein
LAGRIVQRASRIATLHREQLSDIAEFDRAESWRGDGAVSMIAWVTTQCRVSGSTARQWVHSAVNLETLPSLGEALAVGELSLDLVEPLAEVASPATDATLREASRHWSVSQARQLAAWHKAQKEGEAEAAAAAAAASRPASERSESESAREYEGRTLRLSDTRQSVWISFTKEDYAVAKSVLVGRVEARQRQRDAAAGPDDVPTAGADPLGYVPYDKQLYDACIDLFRVGSGSGPASGSALGSASASASGAASGAPTRGRSSGGAVRPRVVVHAPLELLIGCSNGGVAEIAGVGPVPIEVVRRLACDANVDLAIEDASGSVLNQGRARRDPTPVQRIEIDRRDKGCRFPGCRYTEFTNVHHIVHWAHGGETNFDNLVTLCGRHHRAVHELGWSVSGDADDVLTFTSPHGRPMRSAPSPTWRASSLARAKRSDHDAPVPANAGRNGPMRR